MWCLYVCVLNSTHFFKTISEHSSMNPNSQCVFIPLTYNCVQFYSFSIEINISDEKCFHFEILLPSKDLQLWEVWKKWKVILRTMPITCANEMIVLNSEASYFFKHFSISSFKSSNMLLIVAWFFIDFCKTKLRKYSFAVFHYIFSPLSLYQRWWWLLVSTTISINSKQYTVC